MTQDYRSIETKHWTIRTIAVSICAMVVLVAIIAGGVYTAHQNNVKTTKYGIECMKHGGEWRERASGEAYCDK